MFELFIAFAILVITLSLVVLYGSRYDEPDIPESTLDAEKHVRRRR